MAELMRLRVPWSGSPVVGGGLSTFYKTTTGAIGFADAISDFFTAIRDLVPAGVNWNVPSSGDTISDDEGDLTGTWSEPGTGGLVTSAGTANFASGVGARVVWNTGGLFAGRRVRGSTFICPLVASVYPSNNTLDDAAVATIQAAADGLVAALPEMVIWSRHAAATSTHGELTGESNAVTSARVPDLVSWLRSRRT